VTDRSAEPGCRKQEASVLHHSESWILALLCLVAAVPLPAKEKVDLLLRDGTVVTMDGSRRLIEHGAVAVQGERIMAVGTVAELTARYQAKRNLDARGKIVLPGLINTHNHAAMTLLRGIADDLALMDWLQRFVFPAEAKNVSREFVEWGTALACLEMIRSGTTTYADMYYYEDQVAETTAKAGMRGVLGETVIQFAIADNQTPQEGVAYSERFIRRWKNHPLIVPAVAPHAPHTNSAETIKACKELADRFGVPMLIHVSETRDEERQIHEQHGTTSTQWLARLGVLGPNVLLAHGVWLTEADLAVLKQHGVGVAHNPESNMKLASGTAPVPRMLALGIPVGLGTDGAASNNNLDMFEAMDFAAKLHKLSTMDPAAMPAVTVLEMATIGGARALGMGKEIGSLEPGKLADLIVVDTDSAHGLPLYNVYSQLVYDLKGADVRTTVINGKVVMLDRRVLTLDEDRIRQKAREYQTRIAASLRQ
jgi:5-methylthioadenosine/S-adenosylhomocysteine deaminase